MATKHGGRLPGSDGGEENDDERGAEDDSEVHREFGREDFGESEMSSQHTSYSRFGEEDISDLILAFPLATQPTTTEDNPPPSATPSAVSLGKRKADDSSAESIFPSSQASKFPRLNSAAEKTDPPGPVLPADEENPFLDTWRPAAPPPDNINSPIVLSPPSPLQTFFNAKKLPYGVQYEIARLVSLGTMSYDDVSIGVVDEIAKLSTNAEAAPLAAKKFLTFDYDGGEGHTDWAAFFAKESACKNPWGELDKEEEALQRNPYGGLGFDEEGNHLSWHGGQVHFRGTLKDVSPKGSKQIAYKVVLERAELGSSDQFARRFGSKNFFRLKLSKAVSNRDGEELLHFLCRPLVLCSGVFRAFFAKENNVFFVKTNEHWNGRALTSETTPGVLCFIDFLDWHNSMEKNSSQTMAKWASRFALGLSNSVPGWKLQLSQIRFEDDITNLKTGSNMTDGAGSINRYCLRELRHRYDWEEKPTAIQVRLFGAKGLLVENTDTTESPSVILTPSQMKIQYPTHLDPDPAHLIIDLLRSSHSKAPCRLSVETIINLAENGVPKSAFLELLRQGLIELVEPLLDWESPMAMRKLWCNVRKLGGIMAARRAREDAGLARVKGYSEWEAEEVEADDEDGFKQLDSVKQGSSAWWNDEISGCPSSLEETVMYLIDAGFTPQTCPVLRSKLEKIVKSSVKNYIKAYRIDVPMSASAFLVPDILGVLKPGEIFYKSSRRNLRQTDGTETDIMLGDVLITRHPCKLPTDIQKWKAVDRPELHHLTDVIVLPTTGDRRAADLLSGGDYDGDKGLITNQPELVIPFINAPLHFSEPPSNMQKYFVRENEAVPAFLERTSVLSDDAKIHERQQYLLGAIRDTSVVGKYSNFHEAAIYTLGYTHPETIRLAYMFCMTLDGAKTGMTVLPQVLKDDTRKYQKRPPTWKETEEDRERHVMHGKNETNLKRPSSLGRFIMDDLHSQAEAEGNVWLARIEKKFEIKNRIKVDDDLTAPWLKFLQRSKRWISEENNTLLSGELEQIRKHVEAIYLEHRAELNASPRKQTNQYSPKKDKASFTDLPIEVRQDKFRALSRKFASFPRPDTFLALSEWDIAAARASYAYWYDHEQRKQSISNNWTRFPWDVAMRELCTIKARAGGRHKAVAGEFYDHFNMKHPRTHHT